MHSVSLEQLDRDIEALRKRVDNGKAPRTELDWLLGLRKELAKATPDDWEAYRFLHEHLPQKDADELLIIVKGHLLLEFMTRRFVERRMLNPRALDSARLTSSAIISVAEALCLPNAAPKWLWARVRELNALRNKLAHKLKIEGLKKQIDDFVATVSAEGDLAQNNLTGAIAHLYGMIKGLTDLADDPGFKLPNQ
jgi:hypothetical protein